jgi:hypothetical protein
MRTDAPNSADIVLTSLGSDEAVEEVIGELFKGQEVGTELGYVQQCLGAGPSDRCHRVVANSSLQLLRCTTFFARCTFPSSPPRRPLFPLPFSRFITARLS